VTAIKTVVFDLGGVLIDWDPRYLYRTMFDGDDAAMERFLSEICSPEWNSTLDAGRPWVEAIEELTREHPDFRDEIAAFRLRWPEMLGGAIDGTVALLAELRAKGVPLYALSNWSAETFPVALVRYDFLNWFEEVVISGELGITKPDPRIFEHLLGLHGLTAATTLFIDDAPANVTGAEAVGMRCLLFTDPVGLRTELVRLHLLD
jgi:2-haloacid dehalogenase